MSTARLGLEAARPLASTVRVAFLQRVVGFCEIAGLAEWLEVVELIAAPGIDRNNVIDVERYLLSSIAGSNNSAVSARVPVPAEDFVPLCLIDTLIPRSEGRAVRRQCRSGGERPVFLKRTAVKPSSEIRVTKAGAHISSSYLLAEARNENAGERAVDWLQRRDRNLSRFVAVTRGEPDGTDHAFDCEIADLHDYNPYWCSELAEAEKPLIWLIPEFERLHRSGWNKDRIRAEVWWQELRSADSPPNLICFDNGSKRSSE